MDRNFIVQDPNFNLSSLTILDFTIYNTFQVKIGEIVPFGAKQKGKVGEIEACEWLVKSLYKDGRQLEPNHNQMYFGADIYSHPFIIEVKRQEVLTLDSWWIQIETVEKKFAERDKYYIPVVMFRQNRKQWEFLISAETIGVQGGFVLLKAQTFLHWASKYVE